MFHVEHRFFYLILITFALFGCNKPINPFPELMSDVYRDLLSQESNLKNAIEMEKKDVSDKEKEFAEAAPQTGLIKVTKDRLFESKNRLMRLEQELEYITLVLKSKKTELRAQYIKSFNENKEWDANKDSKLYFANKKLKETKVNWTKRAQEAEEQAKTTKAPASAAPPEH